MIRPAPPDDDQVRLQLTEAEAAEVQAWLAAKGSSLPGEPVPMLPGGPVWKFREVVLQITSGMAAIEKQHRAADPRWMTTHQVQQLLTMTANALEQYALISAEFVNWLDAMVDQAGKPDDEHAAE